MASKPIWTTPQWLFDQLDAEFHFDVDLCADPENAKCGRYLSRDESLAANWHEHGRVGFLNPPYGKEIRDWTPKLRTESAKGMRIVAVLPGRTNAPWFHDDVMQAYQLWFVEHKVAFDDGNGSKGVPPWGVVIAVFDTNPGPICRTYRRKPSTARNEYDPNVWHCDRVGCEVAWKECPRNKEPNSKTDNPHPCIHGSEVSRCDWCSTEPATQPLREREQPDDAELNHERLITAVQMALNGVVERVGWDAVLWFNAEYNEAIVKMRNADEQTVFASRKGLPTLTGKRLSATTKACEPAAQPTPQPSTTKAPDSCPSCKRVFMGKDDTLFEYADGTFQCDCGHKWRESHPESGQ